MLDGNEVTEEGVRITTHNATRVRVPLARTVELASRGDARASVVWPADVDPPAQEAHRLLREAVRCEDVEARVPARGEVYARHALTVDGREVGRREWKDDHESKR